jgi:indoleamine 2,3-dioxygenase
MGMLPRGFLPEYDPLEMLPEVFAPWEEVAKKLPKLLVANKLRSSLKRLPAFAVSSLQTPQEFERAMQLLSYLGHAYVWGEEGLPECIPAILAKPWYEVGKVLGRPPVLSYASYALQNWKRIQSDGLIELGNIVLIQNFLGGVDEEWFVLVRVDIEAKAIPALRGCVEAIEAAIAKEAEALFIALQTIEASLRNICKTLDRMPERCDPYIYYTRVRPYIHGWKNHPVLTSGMLYEGVEEYGGVPQKFRGETGAQSSIMPTLDALFGITHAEDVLRTYLLEMREYMPPQHRQFIEYVEAKSRVREFVKETPSLNDRYNNCILLIERFRRTHLGYAASYIQKQHEKSASNPHAVGTGGTPFIDYLKKHYDETSTFLIS